MAKFLNITESDFINEYTKLRPDRQGLSLKDRYDGACILLKDDSCIVQQAKPQQCRDFPNLWNFPNFQNVCQSKSITLSVEDYEARIRSETGRKNYQVSNSSSDQFDPENS